VEEMCRTLDISRSGYYSWIKNAPSREERQTKRERLVEKVRQIHEESLRSYGSPRILRVLQGEGIRCGRHRLEQLMHEEGICGKQKRKWRATTDSPHGNPVVPNRLDRKFEVHEPNRKWVSDITCCATDEGWLYVAAIMDLYSRNIVGWAAGDRITTDLVVKALDRALEKRTPSKGLILHSDRGSQYTSHMYQTKLWKSGIIGSMSRKGNCWDNAPMESFFGTMKTECVYGRKKYRTREEGTTDLFRYIEIFYNRKRLHSGIGYKSPESYEKERLQA
jgi:transposase InsO family protein